MWQEGNGGNIVYIIFTTVSFRFQEIGGALEAQLELPLSEGTMQYITIMNDFFSSFEMFEHEN